MADTKLSALTAVSSVADSDDLYTNEAGTSKRITALQLKTYANTANVFAAGTATAGTAPKFTAGTLLTAAEAGAIEFDTTNLYFSIEASNRGIIPVEYFIRANADRTFTSNTLQQALFTSPTNGALTLPVGVYSYECMMAMDTMSATSGNAKWSLIGAGTATLTQVLQGTWGIDAAVDTGGTWGGNWSQTALAGAGNMVSSVVNTGMFAWAKGSFNVSVTGTIIPSAAQATAAAAVLKTGSYFFCKRMGASGVLSVGNWS